MRFRRYGAWIKSYMVLFFACFFLLFFFAIRKIVISNEYKILFIAIAVSIVSSLWLFLSIMTIARTADCGSLRDYLFISNNNIMLYSKSQNVCIYWEYVTIYKVIKPYRGLQTTIICDSKGNKISFGSSDRLDKKIISFYPEIQSRMTVFSSMKMAEDYECRNTGDGTVGQGTGTGDGSLSHDEKPK